MKIFLLPLLLLWLSASSQTYYIVRHAEKEQTPNSMNMSAADNPPLSQQGKERAETLKNLLLSKNIRFIFSTNTTRTLATAMPLSKAIHIEPEIYGPQPDAAFINKLKALKGNALIVGHSNTVDDIVNGLCNATKVTGDLPDTEFDNLFIVTYKGKKISFQRKRYGKISRK